MRIDYRSVPLGGGRNGRSGIITRRGDSGGRANTSCENGGDPLVEEEIISR